jgi:hypothetical protein
MFNNINLFIMSNVDDYSKKIGLIEALDINDVKKPAIPVDVFTQECEDLYHWCQSDKEKLTAAGLDWTLVDDLPARASACREAQSVWVTERRTRQQAEQDWKTKSPAAYDLRDQLLHTFTYAYRGAPEILSRVAEIRDGNGNADMIQDMNDLSVLGRTHIAQLRSINFDTALLDTAASTSKEMSTVLAMANGDRNQESMAKTIRDKAYTYLKQVVDEINVCGKYVMWQTPERLMGYSSTYQRKNNRRKKDKNPVKLS